MITDFNSGLHFGHLYKFWLYTAKVTIITWLLHRYYYDLFTQVLILRNVTWRLWTVGTELQDVCHCRGPRALQHNRERRAL